jgi:energy-converting hydrogenase Eha subunit E
VTFLLFGVYFLAWFLIFRWSVARVSAPARWASILAFVRRLNVVLAFCGVALIVLGLLFPNV